MSDIKGLVSRLRSQRTAGLRERKGGRATRQGGAHHTYRVELQCEDGRPAALVYELRGATGVYAEDLCDFVLNGTLGYVTDIRITFDDTTELNGLIYNGLDETGSYGYFFGTDDLDGNGSYLIMIGSVYQVGTPPDDFAPWAIATRQ